MPATTSPTGSPRRSVAGRADPQGEGVAMTNLKLNIIGRRRPGTTLAEHRHHIRHVHGKQVLAYIGTEPEHAPRRYVQNAVVDGLFRATAPGSDALALNRDFV